jgi:heme/copper-type cytochrome/quinol oxidase subunit 4
MWESISALIGFVLSITITTMIARRVNASSGRARALVAGLLASAAISIVSDFTLAYFAQEYDRSLEAVISRSLVAALVGLVIAFFVTLKSRTAA